MDPKYKVSKIVEYLEGKKAKDISVINIDGISILADYFVICSGTSTTHIKALADELEEKMREEGCNFFHEKS